MSKQIQVNLAFNADTSKAKAQINDLVASLNKISSKNSQIFDDKGLKDAASAAKDLTKYLEASVNVNTGKLDLNKFTQSLSQSKTSLNDLYNSLSKAGPEGQRAFSQLSSAIASSDSSVLNLNAKVKDLGQTLKNTIKWQLSSSLVHGFMGAMSQAVGYAKDLNSSLNDIRIVTGAGVDEMARFAEQANKSAKALSSTTTEYTKASLIYYQQGLSDSEVKERTDVTIKMANVSKESAQVVSDQMTAVWNNFYDGSKSLEYYADVMTALGAATASSVDEIAGGLEKFAAIGDTIGLSYEYAASALATITSNTRQSEEVVGTALKTIFARIQGLNLGETLDDGTTLNKYSAALDKVGISIFDQAGELKNMDNILSEMGNKWQELSKDQQIALAQTVAGTRQYTQLVALMDNWDNGDSDSFQANLSTAYGSEGALQKQQEIYAESWEAAADRVKAATEDIYDSLLNDEAIIVLLNGLEKILDFTGALIDGFGGLKGILLMVAGIFTRQIANEVPEALGKLKSNFEILTGQGQKKKVAMLEQTAQLRKPKPVEEGGPKEGTAEYTRAMADSQQAEQMAKLERRHSQLTDAQYNSAKAKIDEARASQELVASLQEEIAEKEKAFKQAKRNAKVKNGDQKVSDRIAELDQEIGSTDADKRAAEELYCSTRAKQQSELTSDEAEWMANYERRKAELETLQQMDGSQTVNQALQGQMDQLAGLHAKWAQLNQVIDDYGTQISSYQSRTQAIQDAGGVETEQGAKELKELTTSMENYLTLLNQIDGVQIDIPEFQKVIDEVKAGKRPVEDLIEEFKKISTVQIKDGQITQIGDEAVDAEGRLQHLENQIEDVIGKLEALSPEQFEKLAAAAEEAGISISGLKYVLAKRQNTNQQQEGTDPQLPEMEFSTALTKVAGLGMDIGALFSSVGSAISTCFDESTTAGEKFIAVLSMMPAAAMSIAEITGALKDMPEAINTISEGFAKLKDFSVTGSGLAKVFNSMGTSLSGTAMAGTKMGKAIISAFTGATASAMSFWASLGLIALAIAAVVAVIWLIVKGFEAWQASTPEGKLKAAEEHTAAMAEAAKEANQAYQDLLNTINGYDSATEALDGLTKGTQEFTNKLIEANGHAQELIDKYGIAADEYKVNEDTGLIEFNEGVLDGKQQEYQKKSEIVQSAYNGAKIAESQQKQENLTGDLRKAIVANNEADASFTGSNDTLEKYYEAMKAAGNGTIEGFYALSEEERKAALQGIENSDYNSFESINSNIAALSNDKNLEAMQQYQTSNNQYDNEQRSILKNDLINNLSNEQLYQDSKYKNAILNETADFDAYTAERQKVQQEYQKKNKADTAQSFKDTFGEDQYIYDGNKVFKKDADGNKGEQVDVNTQKQMLTDATVANTLEQQALDLTAKFAKLDVVATEADKPILDALINGNLEALSNEQIASIKDAGGVTLDSGIYDILEAQFGQEKIAEWLNSLNEQVANWEPEPFNTDTWQEQFKKSQEIIGDTKRGENISEEDYNSLNAAAKEYFDQQSDGSWKMMGDPEEIAKVSQNYDLGVLEEQIAAAQKVDPQQGLIEKYSGISTEDVIGLSGAEEVLSEEQLAAMDKYKQWAENMSGQDFSSAGEAAEYIQQQTDSLEKMQQVAVESANELADLDDLMQDGTITQEQYDKGLQNIATKYENTNDELNDFRDALQSGDKEQIKAARNMLELATRSGELAEETGFSAEELENQAKALKNTGKYTQANGKALAEMAKDQLRWNKAVDKAKNSMDDWKKAIQKGNVAEYMDEIKEAYGNMLDIDGSLLGDSFASSAENMEDMKKALEGDEEAYQRLLDAAQQEIETTLNLEGNEEFQAELGEVEAAMSEMNFEDIEVGASLDNAGFLQALTDMVNAAGMTADQATSYLASMGVDATVKPGEPATVTDKVAQGAIATVTQVPGTASTITPDGSGGITVTDVPVSYPSISYEAGPEVEVSKQTTGVGLEVTSANKSSGGAVKNAGGGGGGSKGGGGGGGGKKSEKKKVDKVKKSAVVKRYKRIDDKIDDKQNAAEKASRAMDKMYGASRIKQMQKYNQLLQEEIGLLESKKQEAEDYLKIDQVDLQSSLDDALKQAGFSKSLNFEIDSDGLITNYEEVMTKLWAELDRQITRANNAGGATEEQKEKIDELQEKIDAVTEAVEQYDETRELIEDIENEMAEKALELYDKQLEALSYEIELNLEISDDSLALIEFQLSQIQDNAFKAAEAISLMGSKAGNIEEKMAKTKEALSALTAMTLDGEYTQEQMDLIKEYRDELMDLAQEYAELREQIEEQVIAAFEAWREELDRGISSVEHAGSVLESYKNITDLLGDSLSDSVQDDLYAKFNKGIMDNAINQIEATKAAYEGIQEAQARAQMEYENAIAKGDEASAEMWKNTLNTLNEEAQAAQEAMLDSWENALNAAVEQFEQSVERAVEAFREQFDDLSEKFTRQKETSDMFLNDYQQIYELSKLSRDINKSIDDTESLGGKKKLKGLLEDINKLQEEGVEMSEYDLEYLQKTYDLRLAELELENARNAKNTVRLSKDNEGNWSYVYTTNTDAVDQAQQKYEDALYAMQDLSSNYIDEMSEKLITTSQEMAEALASLRAEDFSSYQEYQDEVNRVTKEYETQLSLQEAELNKAIGNNKVLYNEDWKNYSDATGYKISETDKFVTAFRDSLLGSLIDSTTETSNFMDILSQSSQVLVNSLGENGKSYFENIGSIMQAAGSSTEGFGTDATEAINATSEASKEATESVSNMATEMVDDFSNISDAVIKWQSTYSEAIGKALDDTENLVGMINAMNESLVKGNGIPQGVSIDTNGQASYNEDDDITANIVKQLVDMDLNKLDPESLSYALSETLSSMKVEDFDNIQEYMKAIENVQTQYREALKNITTGQTKDEYIGQWEYLEKIMTKDSYATTEGTIPDSWAPVLADVIDKISTNAQQMSLGVGQWAAQVIKDELIQTLQQDVSITAEFPNVNDHNEIEEAIKDLINTASQYAHRK